MTITAVARKIDISHGVVSLCCIPNKLNMQRRYKRGGRPRSNNAEKFEYMVGCFCKSIVQCAQSHARIDVFV